MCSEKKFKFYWKDGTTEIGYGETVDKAFFSLGYGSGALGALDNYEGLSYDADDAAVE